MFEAMSAGSIPSGSLDPMHMPRNRLLRALPSTSLDELWGSLEYVDLSVRQSLVDSDEATEHVYFIESGLASVVIASPSQGERIEVGHIGFEGMSGLHLVLGVDRTPANTFMQAVGSALRLPASDLRDAMRRDEALREKLLHYVQAYQVQVAYAGLANGRYTIPERLARWLLMCHDRLETDTMRLTHEFLALMLGVRRPGVTNEIHVLEGAGAIRATRANIHIISRATLEEFAGEIYGVPEAEYKRLVGDSVPYQKS